jgi:CRP/FNR family transcriptional regulator, nitrogen fixation regulation protein
MPTPHAIGPLTAPRPFVGPDENWLALGIITSRPRGSEVFAEGDPATRVYKVVSGAVRVCKLLADGRRQIAGFYLPGEFFALEAGATHRFSAEAIVDTTLQGFTRKALHARAARDPVLSERLWGLTGANLDRAQEHMLLLGRKSAAERVATFLLDMAARTDAADTVDLPMSRQDIADFLGLTIETVSRTLTQLERDGTIALPGHRKVVLKNRRRLLAMEG